MVERGADDEFESASTIKLYILGCLYAQAEAGKASLDAALTYEARHFVDGSGLIRSLGEGARLRARDVATLMIVVSDNIATNMLIDYLGLEMCIRDRGVYTQQHTGNADDQRHPPQGVAPALAVDCGLDTGCLLYTSQGEANV